MTRRPDHTILATADGQAFRSVRERTTTRAERFALGEELREQVPHKDLGRWTATAARFDPLALIKLSQVGRVPELLPIQREFYLTMLTERKEKILDYSLELLMEQEQHTSPVLEM